MAWVGMDPKDDHPSEFVPEFKLCIYRSTEQLMAMN